MDKEEKQLLSSRLTLALLKKLPRELLIDLRDSDVDTIGLIKESETLNRILGVHNCPRIQEWDISEALKQSLLQIEYCESHSVDILTPWDDSYPYRLLQTPDFPRQLFKFGNCDLNDGDFLAIVGTRRCTSYGETFVHRAVKELTPLSPRLLIISGLAYGIDASAHKGAIEARTPTIAVLAHGFGSIYPSSHRDLASRIRKEGGCLVTEYLWGEKPFRQRFLERNRIIAGLSDAVFVAESAIKGGAMSTANTAFSLSRTVMALPGRISDETSTGCNLLIAQQKAQLVSSPADIAHHLGLDMAPEHVLPVLPHISPELSGDEKRIFEIICMEREPIQLDELCNRLQMPIARLSALLGELEFDGIVTRLPGNRFVAY